MPDSQKPIDSTQPGPFQKYLFSGACYVQIGQCYKKIKQLTARGQRVSDQAELIESLRAIWSSFIAQRPDSAISGYLENVAVPQYGDHKAFENLYREINDAGRTTAEKFLNAIDTDQAEQLDVKRFFGFWASTCDEAYQNIVSSENYAVVIGQMINAAIRSSRAADSR